VRRAVEPLRESSASIAARTVDLRLSQVDRAVEVGSAQVGVAEIYSEDVASVQLRPREVSGDRDAPADGEPAKVCSGKLGAHQIAARFRRSSATAALRWSESGASDLTRVEQKAPGRVVFRIDVEIGEFLR